MLITVLHVPQSKYGPYHVVYALRAWPAMSRRNRGWEKATVVYERPATEAEMKEHAASRRYISYRYRDWDQLHADEALYGIDANAERERWCERRRA